jgi:hypothetical protein
MIIKKVICGNKDGIHSKVKKHGKYSILIFELESPNPEWVLQRFYVLQDNKIKK